MRFMPLSQSIINSTKIASNSRKTVLFDVLLPYEPSCPSLDTVCTIYVASLFKGKLFIASKLKIFQLLQNFDLPQHPVLSCEYCSLL